MLFSSFNDSYKRCEPSFDGLKLVFSETLGLCTTSDGKPIIWTFWDYARMSAFAVLATAALRCHNWDYAHVQWVNDRNFRTFFRDMNWTLPPLFDRLHAVH